MQRKPALAIAGAITSTVVAGALAVAANLGVIGSRGVDPVGNESPISAVSRKAKPRIETIVVDVTPKPKVREVVVNTPASGDSASTGGAGSVNSNSNDSFDEEDEFESEDEFDDGSDDQEDPGSDDGSDESEHEDGSEDDD